MRNTGADKPDDSKNPPPSGSGFFFRCAPAGADKSSPAARGSLEKPASLYAFLLTSESTLLGLDGTLTAHKNDRSDLNTALELLSSIFNSD